MKKLFVEDVKVGVSRGGMACGPVSGSVVAEVCIRDLEKETAKYYSLTEVEGVPNFFETDESTYDRQIEEVDDEEFWDMLSAHTAGDFSDYYGVYANQEEFELHDPEHLLVWKYLIYMVRADKDEIEQLKADSVGKCLGDFEIPVCDVEQEYLDDIADGETEEVKSDVIENLLEDIREEFVGLTVNTSGMDLEENESPEGYYSSNVIFREGQNEYKLEYNLDVDEKAKITYVGKPICKMLVGEEYISCPEGKVDADKIAEVLRDELNSWL